LPEANGMPDIVPVPVKTATQHPLPVVVLTAGRL